MGDYIKEAIARTNIQDIREFLLYGVEEDTHRDEPYDIWIKKECDPIYKRIESIYPDGDKRDEAVADLTQALTAYQSTYMEIGMKAGARLIYQLLLTTE
jgi:hypothetical protein